jgi:membrane protein DedA with SNARE-associated domain
MLLVWVAVTVLVGYPYVEKIEKPRDDGKRYFSYFVVAVAGWSMLVARLAEKCLEITGVNEEEDLW